MCQATWVDHDAIGAICSCGLDAVDNGTLPVAATWVNYKSRRKTKLRCRLPLVEVNGGAKILCLLFSHLLHILKSLMAIELWLTSSQQVQVGPINDKHSLPTIAHFDEEIVYDPDRLEQRRSSSSVQAMFNLLQV